MSRTFPAAAAAVLVVSPPTLQRQGLIATLADARPDLSVTSLADALALQATVCRNAFGLIILDAAVPGPPLPELLSQVQQVPTRPSVLVLGGRRLPFGAARLVVEMGGRALLARHATPANVVAAVTRLVGAGHSGGCQALSPDISLTAAARPVYSRPTPTAPILSRRELEVLRLVVDEYGNSEIADRLSLSVRTVESHRRALLAKTGTRSFVGLALLAVRQGWVSVESV
jgi:DNA-binding NarL/FixJ family response regulator